jgi:hypothetical protein
VYFYRVGQPPHLTSGLRLACTAVRTPAGWRLRSGRRVAERADATPSTHNELLEWLRGLLVAGDANQTAHQEALLPQSFALACVESNSSSLSCDCLTHRFGNAADRPDRAPCHASEPTGVHAHPPRNNRSRSESGWRLGTTALPAPIVCTGHTTDATAKPEPAAGCSGPTLLDVLARYTPHAFR